MKYMYIPHRLIAAKDDIIFSHKKIKENKEKAFHEDLHAFVRRISLLDKERVKVHTITMTNREVERIAAYIPYNQYKVDMRNLFDIFKMRINLRLCEILFDSWLDSYDNAKCNAFMRDELMEMEEFSMVVLDHNFTENEFRDLLASDDIISYMGDLISHEFDKGNYSLRKRVGHWKIRDDCKLYANLSDIFYTFCSEDDYLGESEDRLLRVAKRYVLLDNGLINRFIVNLMKNMSLEELENLKRLANYLIKQTGDTSENRFRVFFEGIDDELVEKYEKWLDRLGLNGILH